MVAACIALGAAGLAVADLPPRIPRQVPCRYEVIAEITPPVLPPPCHATVSAGRAVNERHDVVGRYLPCTFPSPARPFSYNTEDGFIPLGIPSGGDDAVALDSNEHWQVVGRCTPSDSREFLHRGGQFIELPLLRGMRHSGALAKSGVGAIAGYLLSSATSWRRYRIPMAADRPESPASFVHPDR
jgi:hypothetical protein